MFILGVATLAIVIGGLLLRSAVTTRGVAADVAGPSTSLATQPGPSGTQVASPSSLPTSTPTDPPTSPTPTGLSGYVWPLTNAKITLPFGPSPWGEFFVNGKRFHDGVDMATQCGDSVHAAHDGTVLAAGRRYDEYMGWLGDIAPYYALLDRKHWWNSLPIVIVIDDGDGYRSIYAHESKVTVTPGQHVTAGQVIGYEGATGNASGCHVHFGLFNPAELATFQLDPGIVSRDLLPSKETARIDPLLVLPFRCDIAEMQPLRPAEAAACPAPTPKPTATAKSTAKPTAKSTPKPTAQPTASPAASESPSAQASESASAPASG